MNKNLDKKSVFLNFILAIIVLWVAYISIDGILSKKVRFEGKILDKCYHSQNNPEQYNLFLLVETDNKKIIKVNCELNSFSETKIGQSINYNVYKGLFTGKVWSQYSIERNL
jgi:hypothetical protein